VQKSLSGYVSEGLTPLGPGVTQGKAIPPCAVNTLAHRKWLLHVAPVPPPPRGPVSCVQPRRRVPGGGSWPARLSWAVVCS
jgi:hypothetical protein